MVSYDLHKIGWKQFEELCVTTLHSVFAKTVTPYALGKDGGRDAFFDGELSDHEKHYRQNLIENYAKGKVVFQFKHTSKENEILKYTTIKNEIDKLNRMISEGGIDYYVILTNFSVSGEKINEIKYRILSEVDGLKGCEIHGKEWFDLIIEEHDELKRHIPRVYGIGDLSQILDSRVMQQSRVQLENWSDSIRTFVISSFYNKAIDILWKDNFVMVIGEPQSGKTSIAQNICLSILEKDSDFVLISLSLHEFNNHYNPNDCKRIYFFDDAFGEQSVYEPNIQKLNERIFSNLTEAIKRGAYVIFTCRDYIYNKLITTPKIKRCTRSFPRLFDKQVVVKVSDYTTVEREKILYKHIKFGNLPKKLKSEIKPFLREVAMQNDFTPELSRRLGDINYSRNVEFTVKGIVEFFSKQIKFLQDVFSELEESKQAALLLVLLKDGLLPVSISEKDLDEKLKKVYDINSSDITKSLQHMKNSLVKQEIIGNNKVWKPYHPSMKEALIQYVKEHEEMIEIFICLADFKTLVNETSIIYKENKLFISKDQWELLSKRLFDSLSEVHNGALSLEDYYLFKREDLVKYFVYETNADFLRWFHHEFSDSQIVWEQLTTESIFNQLHSVDTYEFAYRLIELGLLSNDTKEKVLKRIKSIGYQTFDLTFLEDGSVRKILNENDIELLFEHYEKYGVEMAEIELEQLFNNFEICSEDIEWELDQHFNQWFHSVNLLMDELGNRSQLTVEVQNTVDNLIDKAESWKEEWLNEYEENNKVESNGLIKVLIRFLTRMKSESNSNIPEIMNEMINEITEEFFYDRTETIQYVRGVLNRLSENNEDWIVNLSHILSQSYICSDDMFSDVDE